MTSQPYHKDFEAQRFPQAWACGTGRIYGGRLCTSAEFFGSVKLRSPVEATNFRYGLRRYLEFTLRVACNDKQKGAVSINAGGKTGIVTWCTIGFRTPAFTPSPIKVKK